MEGCCLHSFRVGCASGMAVATKKRDKRDVSLLRGAHQNYGLKLIFTVQ